MRLTLAAIGRLKAGPDRELFERYWGRLEASGRAAGLTSVKCVELPESRAASGADRRADEAARLLKAFGKDAYVIALDERGQSQDSDGFAKHIRQVAEAGRAELAVLIGGPDGHDASVSDTVNFVLTLGRLTLPHGLARSVIAEQLSRATTILTGHPYHRS